MRQTSACLLSLQDAAGVIWAVDFASAHSTTDLAGFSSFLFVVASRICIGPEPLGPTQCAKLGTCLFPVFRGC